MGTSGHPLAYVILDAAPVPAATGKPTIGEPNCTYGSICDEVMAWASVDPADPAFITDNARVLANCSMLRHLTDVTFIFRGRV